MLCLESMTWQEYETDLEEKLADLHSRIHRGTYRAQPSKRAYIPKADGRQRPLGIAALEDKIVQQAVVTVLNQIYEEDFVGFCYGFRPGRSQHDALDALWAGIMRKKVNWILDADIRGSFHYHAVPGNIDSLDSFRAQVIWRWFRALRRRSQHERMTWERFRRLVDRWIPSAKILHPHPNVRFDARDLR